MALDSARPLLSVLLLQPSALQRRAWQRVLASQGIAAIAPPLPQDNGSSPPDPLAVLAEDATPPRAWLVLADPRWPGLDWAALQAATRDREPPLPLFALAPEPGDAIDGGTDDGAPACPLPAGAEALPAFDCDNLIPAAIAAIRRILAEFGQALQQEPLVRELTALKRDFSESADCNDTNASAIDAPVDPDAAPAPPAPAADPSPRPGNAADPSPKRRYRGRIY